MTAPLVSIGQGEYRRDYYAPLKITANHSELDTLYCDVIVQRWEKFTGKKAERIPGIPGGAAATPAEVN